MTLWRPAPRVIVALVAGGFSSCVDGTSWAFAAPPVSAGAGADPVQVARDVFQDQDFWWKRIETRTVPTSWLESILRAIGDAIGRVLREILDRIGWLLGELLRRLFGLFTGDFSAGTLLLWLIVVILLAWSAWKLYPVIARWLGGGPARPPGAGEVAWQTLAEPSDLIERAGRAFREGIYAEAIRLALLALIARLEKDGLLRYDTTRTNREYQRELRPRSELAAMFGQLARIYERVWYGRVPADRAGAEQAINLCKSAINREDFAPE